MYIKLHIYSNIMIGIISFLILIVCLAFHLTLAFNLLIDLHLALPSFLAHRSVDDTDKHIDHKKTEEDSEKDKNLIS